MFQHRDIVNLVMTESRAGDVIGCTGTVKAERIRLQVRRAVKKLNTLCHSDITRHYYIVVLAIVVYCANYIIQRGSVFRYWDKFVRSRY